MPTINEYWYIVGHHRYYDDYGTCVLSKIVGVGSSGHVIKNCYGTFTISSDKIIAKWEPNWFWKLLGYK